MRIFRTKGLVAGVLAFFCSAAMQAQTTHHAPLASTIRTILSDPKIEGAHWGISVTQLDGTSIFALDDGKLFEPASNNKLFTTAAALDVLGGDTTYKTRLTVLGRRAGDTVQGMVLLEGDGDAFLSDRAVPYNVVAADATTPPTLSKLDALAAQVAAAGITRIDGPIIAKSLYPWEPYGDGWNADDLPWGYGAPVSGIAINDNELQLMVTPAASAGDPPTLVLAPDIPYYTLENDAHTVPAKTASNINLVRDGRTLRVFGQIATDAGAGEREQHVAIDDPAAYITGALKVLLANHGVTVTGEGNIPQTYPENLPGTRAIIHEPLDLTAIKKWRVPGSKLLSLCADPCESDPLKAVFDAEHISPSLRDDVIATNKNSQNLHAELLLRKLAERSAMDSSQEITFAQGARVVRQFAINAGVKPNDFFFVDGSGLSTYDLVAPRAITQLLRYAAKQPWGADYKASLPIGGVDGTLEHRFTKAPLKGNVFAKTGTLSEERALSGYLVCASGKTVVFSILVGQHLPGSTADRDALDKIVAAIYAAN